MQVINGGPVDKIELLAMIDQKRFDLIEIGKLNNYVSEEVVKCSQELDRLIVTFQKSCLRSK